MRPRREKDPKVETCPATLVSLCHFAYTDFLSPDLMVSLPLLLSFWNAGGRTGGRLHSACIAIEEGPVRNGTLNYISVRCFPPTLAPCANALRGPFHRPRDTGTDQRTVL